VIYLDHSTPPVARVSPPAIGSSDAGGDTRATNSAQAPGGYRVTDLPVDREGLLNLADLEAAITDDTAVVSLMVKCWMGKLVA
jgi:hypothetical protein